MAHRMDSSEEQERTQLKDHDKRRRLDRIVYVHLERLDSSQANAVHVMRMCDALASHIRNVTMIAYGAAGGSAEVLRQSFGTKRPFDIVLIDEPRSMLSAAAQVVPALLRATRFGTSGLIYTRSAFGALIASVLPRPLVVEQHAPPSVLRPRLRFAFTRLLTGGRLRALVVISQKLQALFSSEFGPRRNDLPRVIVAHDGADAIERAPLASGSREFVAGYAGHLYPGRGIELIVKCARACPEIKFMLAGGYPQDIERWQQEPDLPTNVEFVGRLPPRDVAGFLLRCDVLLAPYARKVYTQNRGLETSEWMSPLKVFEYMATGRAIVCSRLPVLEEILEDGRNAMLCDPENPEAWVQALGRLRSDPDLARRDGDAARADLEQRYTWEERCRLILDSIAQP